MWAFGSGYIDDTATPTNYVSTDPSYDPYGSTLNTPWYANSGLWSSVIGGIGGYAEQQAAGDAAANKSKLDARAQVELAKQQRQYEIDDRLYRQGTVSNWSKYFG